MAILTFLDIAPWGLSHPYFLGRSATPWRGRFLNYAIDHPSTSAGKSRIGILAAVARVVTHFRTLKTPNGPFGDSATPPLFSMG